MMFSIIVPVYNAEKYLRPCLDSVLSQTEMDWECICVDDGSKDASGAILDEYAAKDSRFKVIHQENQGVSVARNVALKLVGGKWITWLDADDMYALTRLEVARVIIAKEAPDLVRFRTLFFSDVNEIDVTEGANRDVYNVFEGNLAKIWGWTALTPAGMVWTWVAKVELLKGLEFPVGMRIKEDSIYCGMFNNRLTKVVQSEFRAYNYRQIPDSAIHSVRKADDCIRLLKEVKALYQSQLNHITELEPKVWEAMVQRLRVHAESDILDWISMRNGEKNRDREIHALYEEMRQMGVCDCKCTLQRRMRLPFWFWDKLGWMWPLKIVNLSVALARKFYH